MFDVVIIGCGIIGAATAFELSKYDLKVAVLEKENDVAMGTTRANSAILHAGYDPEPGTLMARLNVKGVKMAKELCAQLDVPYQQIGSLVLAFDEADRQTLQQLYERGTANGVEGMRILSGEEAREMEPNLSPEVKGALYAPSAAIVNPWEYCLAFAEVAVQNGVQLMLDHEVTGIRREGDHYRILCGEEEIETKAIVNAAGVHSGRVHDMVCPHSFTIRPNIGQYYLMDKTEGKLVSHVIFQCPSAVGKGVLVSPTVHGNLLVGPNSLNVEDADREGTTADGLAFVRKTATRSVPGINYRYSIRNFAGLRANAAEQDDFIIEEAMPGFIDLAGIKSPGLSAAPAIALEAVELLKKTVTLNKKTEYVQTRRHVRFNEAKPEEKAELIRRNPLYGRVICRCETITEGEIIDAVHSPIPPRSVDGVKRRAGTGMGRCQGGFCGPRVLEILARELGVSPADIPKDRRGSMILVGKTKEGD